MPITNDFGVFLPLTSVYDPESLYELENLDPQIKNFIVASTHSYNDIANVVNYKETGYYITTEIVNSQYWFKQTLSDPSQSPFRNAYRIVVNFGALPNATTRISST
jgi:hypothetical protein